MEPRSDVDEASVAHLALIGGDLCLDFVNTVGNHGSDQPIEHLTSYRAFLGWSAHVGLISDHVAQVLRDQAERQPVDAQRVLERSIELREALYRIFSATAAGRVPKAEDLEFENEVLGAAAAHRRIAVAGNGFAWTWTPPEHALDQMVWPIAQAAADLLTSDRLARVHECAGGECGWLFVDLSKNRSRRWCSMGDCGNRDKVRRFYARRRSDARSEA